MYKSDLSGFLYVITTVPTSSICFNLFLISSTKLDRDGVLYSCEFELVRILFNSSQFNTLPSAT